MRRRYGCCLVVTLWLMGCGGDESAAPSVGHYHLDIVLAKDNPAVPLIADFARPR